MAQNGGTAEGMNGDGIDQGSLEVIENKCQVETVLVEAQRDLDNAAFRMPFLCNPVRHFFLRPALSIASAILPPVAKAVPILDEVTAAGLSIPFNMSRAIYMSLHSEQSAAQWKTYHDAIQEFKTLLEPKETSEREVVFRKAKEHTTKGFLISATVEILSDPKSNMQEWLNYTKHLSAYIKAAGIDDEISRTFGSQRLLLDARILGNIQAIDDNVQTRRIKTAIPGATFDISPKVVAKLMRYCCSAYGRQMMEAADMIAEKNGEPTSTKYRSKLGSEALKQQVCEHVGIPSNYITYFCMGHGGSMRLLRHYISTDHELGAVVLVIRGTYSVSGWHIDFQGQATEFCGGLAHSGMAAMAKAIVENSEGELIDALKRYPGYKLIITGQSLGGGVSPLVNLLCHKHPVIGKRQIKCHAFAGPPVYYAEKKSNIVQKAIDNCTHYVNGDDVVPYLCVHTVRRLLAKLRAVDAVKEKTKFLDAELMAIGRKTPSPDFVTAETYGDVNVEPVPGGPVLMTPAKQVIWFVQDQNDETKVTYMVCDAKKFSELGILLSSKGFDDHVPPEYEFVLNAAEVNGWEQVLPPGAPVEKPQEPIMNGGSFLQMMSGSFNN